MDEDLTVIEDDWKTQFWQFRVHPIELPTSTLYAWVELYDYQIAWSHVGAYVNDMGKSPSSNITSSTSIHHVDVWKRNMVAISAPMIATMGAEMNDMLEVRRERYGAKQASALGRLCFYRRYNSYPSLRHARGSWRAGMGQDFRGAENSDE